jgi:hypothetical protein
VPFWDGVNFAALASRFKVIRSDYELAPMIAGARDWEVAGKPSKEEVVKALLAACEHMG